MTPETIQEYVGSIQQDLPSVEWSETTPKNVAAFKEHGATTFSGTGKAWTHNFVIFKTDEGVSCEGSAMNLKGPLIVRYTPSLAQQALNLIESGGLYGGAKEET